MSKIAYFSMSLVGAVPAGVACGLVVKNFIDRGFGGSTLVQVLLWTTFAVTLFVAITPFIILVTYKAPQLATGPAEAPGEGSEPQGKAGKKKGDEDDGFGDAIPDDFSEDELNASQGGDEEADEYAGGDEDFAYDEEELVEEVEEEKPKKKKKR